MKTVYLSLGSNLGNREEHLRNAVAMLRKAGVNVSRISSLYETEPMELRDQPWFLNLVLEASTELFPLQLLSRIQQIEKTLGRRRTVAKGPRTVDIDILLYGNQVIHTARLQVPHPGFTERRFVLEPLLELAPDLQHPATRRPIRELSGKVARQVVKKIGALDT